MAIKEHPVYPEIEGPGLQNTLHTRNKRTTTIGHPVYQEIEGLGLLDTLYTRK